MSDTFNMTPEDIFLLWKTEARDIGKAKYTSVERIEQLDILANMFFERGIDIEEARMFKRKVVEFLVTKEGMKGNGRYKGWKERAEEDFLASLLVYYKKNAEVVNDTTNLKVTRKVEFYGGAEYMERTPLLVAWSKHKFKTLWSEAICLETHKVGSALWIQFQKEVMFSKWAKSGERPQWAKNVF